MPLRHGIESSVICNNSLPGKPQHELITGQAYLIPGGIDLGFHFSANSALIAIHFALEPVAGLDLFRHVQVCQNHSVPAWLRAAFGDDAYGSKQPSSTSPPAANSTSKYQQQQHQLAMSYAYVG